MAKLKGSAKAYDEAANAGVAGAAQGHARVNAILRDIDQSLLDPEGLARIGRGSRTWPMRRAC